MFSSILPMHFSQGLGKSYCEVCFEVHKIMEAIHFIAIASIKYYHTYCIIMHCIIYIYNQLMFSI